MIAYEKWQNLDLNEIFQLIEQHLMDLNAAKQPIVLNRMRLVVKFVLLQYKKNC